MGNCDCPCPENDPPSEYDNGNEAQLHPILRTKYIQEYMVHQHPYNCIGMIRLVNPNTSRTSFASGFLISSYLVLTSAHIFFEQTSYQILEINPYEFCLELHGSIVGALTNRVGIEDFRFSEDYYPIIRKKLNYNKKSNEAKRLHLESTKYDYALLKLNEPVSINNGNFPELIPDFREPNRDVTVCGYNQYMREQYYQMYHSNNLQYRQFGGCYDLDTLKGQSGGPVYLSGEKYLIKVVGIHKGYNNKDNLNICTLITTDIINHLKEWAGEMNNQFISQISQEIVNSNIESIDSEAASLGI